jgi:hypothetical protein
MEHGMKFKRFNRSRLASVKRFIVGLTILPLISGGCVPSEPPLVDIRALQKSERESAREAQLPPKRAAHHAGGCLQHRHCARLSADHRPGAGK